MDWKTLLCEKRQREHTSVGNTSDPRNEFQKDYHRIIGSASFRRLQDKTQVFPLDKSDFVRTRLTHSLEVSSFAKSLGQMIFQNIIIYRDREDVNEEVKDKICNVLECAGLIHDIGNPPFGHFGEDSIRDWFTRNLNKFKRLIKCLQNKCLVIFIILKVMHRLLDCLLNFIFLLIRMV